MSSIITSLLSSTVGLLLNKARDYTAEKLKDGDLTDEQYRKLIVRELDDIKSKLDGLARKDLLSSLNFLEEGVCLLNMSLGKSSHDETRQGIGQTEALIDEALPFARLSQAIVRLKIASEERFTAAKASFKSARERATDAFSNEALNTEDRVFATKLRMISRILESLEDPDAAANACQLYLQALHAMPAVQGIFSVHASGGMRSRFKKTKRLENVKSVTMINYVLFHFIDKFTKTQWPSVFNQLGIELGKRSYYPLYEGSEILAIMGVESQYLKITCDVKAVGKKSTSVVNSNREIIIKSNVSGNVNIINSRGETKLFCSIPQKETEANYFVIHSLAIDGENNVYIATSSKHTGRDYSFNLYIFDPAGNLRHQFPLHFLTGKTNEVEVAINMLHNIIIRKFAESRVYVCNNKGELQYSFSLGKYGGAFRVFLSISDKNEIVAAPRYENTVYIYTEQGKLKRKIKLPKNHQALGVAFNYIAKKVVVYAKVGDPDTYHLLSFSLTFERQTLPLLHDASRFDQLTSHPNGPLAVVHDKGVNFF